MIHRSRLQEEAWREMLVRLLPLAEKRGGLDSGQRSGRYNTPHDIAGRAVVETAEVGS